MELAPDRGDAGEGKRTFLPPAGLDDYDPYLSRIWHQQMEGWFEQFVREITPNAVAGKEQTKTGGVAFYVPSRIDCKDEQTLPILWRGFPRTLNTLYEAKAALEAADALAFFGKPDKLWPPGSAPKWPAYVDPQTGRELVVPYRLQDEYLEWRVTRNPTTGKISRITFTCESPEYWITMARYDPAKVLALYRRWVHPFIEWRDLIWETEAANDDDYSYQAGDYNPRNKWNTTHGIMHLSHPANEIAGEIELVAKASILRPGINTTFLSEHARLICCGAYGDPNRSSDPQIGGLINQLVQRGYRVSLAIPVGLCIDRVDVNCFTDRRGRDVPNFWQVLRGDVGKHGDPDCPSNIFRLEYAVPRDRYNYEVGDLCVDGEPITFGGQLASHVYMRAIASFIPDANAVHLTMPCEARAFRLKSNIDYLRHADSCPTDDYEPAFPTDEAFAARKRSEIPSRKGFGRG